MVSTFISLLGSLAQANFVWYGDIVLNVAMSGGGVDWPWICILVQRSRNNAIKSNFAV